MMFNYSDNYGQNDDLEITWDDNDPGITWNDDNNQDVVWTDVETVDIPQNYPPNETPAEALEGIIMDTINMARELGKMTDDEINWVLEKILEARLTEWRKSVFKVHRRD